MTDRKPIVLGASGQQQQEQSGDPLQLPAAVAGGASLNMPAGTAPTSPVDGDIWTTTAGLFVRINGATVGPISSSVPEKLVAFFFTTTPAASEVLALYAAVDAFTIPANMAGSQVKVGTNATATFAIDVQQNGTSIGTISIATSGTATLTTTSGTAKSIAAGDVIKFVAPATPDATIANVAINIKGTL